MLCVLHKDLVVSVCLVKLCAPSCDAMSSSRAMLCVLRKDPSCDAVCFSPTMLCVLRKDLVVSVCLLELCAPSFDVMCCSRAILLCASLEADCLVRCCVFFVKMKL